MASTLQTSLPYIDLIFTGTAVGLWMALPKIGPWPLLLGLIPWALRRWMTGQWGLQNPFLAPVGLFLLSAVIGVWAAYDLELASAKFWLIVGAILLFFTLSRWLTNDIFRKDQKSVTQLFWISSLLGALASLYFIVTYDWDNAPTKFGLLESIGNALQAPILGSIKTLDLEPINRNVMAGILAVLAPFASGTLWIGAKKNSRPSQVIGTVTLTLILLGLFLTGSRGSWLALGAAAFLVVWWQIAKRLAETTRGRSTTWFLGVPLMVVGIGVFILVVRPSLTAQFLANWLVAVTGPARTDLYANSLTLIRDYPFTGGGLSGFMMLYSTYTLLAHVGFSTHSHNLFMDLIVEQGILAIIALGWMWFFMGKAIWQSLLSERANGSPATSADSADSSSHYRSSFSNHGFDRRVLLGSAGLSLLVMAVHGLVDDPLYSSRGLVLMFIPLASAAPMIQRNGIVEADPRRLIAVIGLSLLFVLGLFFWRPVASTLLSNLAAVRQSKAELSVYSRPDYPVQDAVRREIDLNQVLATYERSLDLYPANSSALRRLGQIELSLGYYQSALDHLESAYKEVPEERATRRLLAEALAVNGNVEEGKLIWRTLESHKIPLSARLYWYQSLGETAELENLRRVYGTPAR